MADKITVIDLPGLTSHGEVAKTWGPAYQEAIAGASSQLKAKVEGSHSDAINAYIARVNHLGNQVLVRYPALLNSYASTVATYASALSGAGFSSKVKTETEGINSIKEFLEVTSKNKMIEISDNLEPALKAAVEALNMEPFGEGKTAPDLTSLETDGESALKTLATNRQDKHDELIGAFNTFKESLDGLIGQFGTLYSDLNNAKFMHSLPAPQVMDLIANGHLTEDNMTLLNLIKGEGDGRVVAVLAKEANLSKKDFYTELGRTDVTDVSNGVMEVIYGLVYRETKSDGNLENVQHFMEGMSHQHRTKTIPYLEGLVTAGDRLSLIMSSEAIALMPKFPGEGATQEEYDAYWEAMNKLDRNKLSQINTDLKGMGLLTAFFTSAYAYGVGRMQNMTYSGPDTYQRFTVENLRKTADGDLTWTLREYHDVYNDREAKLPDESYEIQSSGDDDGTKVTASLMMSEKETGIKVDQMKLSQLDQKRAMAIKDFLASAASVGAGPVLGFSIGVVNNLLSGDGSVSATISQVNDLGAGLSQDYKTTYKDRISHVQNSVSLFEKLAGIEAEAQAIHKSSGQKLFDIGGYAYESDQGGLFSNNSAEFTINYDLQAILTAHDMDENGLRSYIYRTNGQGEDGFSSRDSFNAVNQFDKYMNGDDFDYSRIDNNEWFDDSQRGEKVKAYIAGESNEAISDLGQTYITMGIDELSDNIPTTNGKSDFNFNGPDYYEDNSRYFNHLVGEGK